MPSSITTPSTAPTSGPASTSRPRRRAALLVAAALGAAAVVLPAAPAGAAPALAPARTSATALTTSVAASATPWRPTWTTTLRSGSRGSAVKAAQRRLAALGYWVGTPDGQYGPQTVQAVLALQKTVGVRRTGVLDATARRVLTAGTRPQARTRTGTTLEIDLRRQLLLVVVDGRTRWAFNTSTGSGRVYYQGGVRQVAVTPRGHFSILRQIDGRHVAPLGVLYRPKFFVGGYAIHGSSSIPAYPASHGCARLSDPAISYLWNSGLAPLGRRLWIY